MPFKSSSSKKKSSSTASAGLTQSGVFYDSDKGRVLQALMVRWWYAIPWPERGSIPPAPAGFEALEGFPGVFVGTCTENLGEIKDTRNKATCPSFRNLSQKSTAELKELCERVGPFILMLLTL
jgi:hypothetical protein